MALYLGLDVGTTGAKALLCREDGRVLGRGYSGYELESYPDGRVEQRAEDWAAGAVGAARQALAGANPEAVRALSLSTQGASMTAVDSAGRALRPALTWMDGRASAEIAELTRALGEGIYRRSGWPPMAALNAAKALWLRRNEPELFANADKFVTTIEYVNRFLCGEAVTDYTNAAIGQLFDINTLDWDGAALDAVGLSRERMPLALRAGTDLGCLTAEAADALGLRRSTRVYNGAHDQYCAAAGSGALGVGEALISTGTTWVVAAVGTKPVCSGSGVCTGPHLAEGRWNALGSLVSAGSVMKWLAGIFGAGYAELDAGASTHAASSAKLIFRPYLAGSGFPHASGEASGSIEGLRLAHDKFDIARALMDCVALEARSALDELARLGVPTESITMTGGAAKSALWREITAMATGRSVLLSAEPDGCALGAAMLAAVGDGVYPSLDDAAAAMTGRVPLDVPRREEMREFYDEKYRLYTKQS